VRAVIPLTRLTPPHVVFVFVFIDLRWDAAVHIVDIFEPTRKLNTNTNVYVFVVLIRVGFFNVYNDLLFFQKYSIILRIT
jgi:hypothetical protein